MFRRLVAVVLLLLVISLPVCADSWGVTWQWNQFTKDYEKLYYEIRNYALTYDYDTGNEVFVESKNYQLLEVKKLGDGEFEVTQAVTSIMNEKEIEGLSFLGGGFSALASILSGGSLFSEMMMMGLFASELEFEVGNTMQTWDGSRLRVVEETSVAGVDGYLVRKMIRKEDEQGRREIVVSEWIINPEVGWPLALKVFDEQGNVLYDMRLVEYAKR
jgi:hypothetical protein